MFVVVEYLAVLVRPSQASDLQFVRAKLSFRTSLGIAPTRGTEIRLPVSGNIKHGAHRLDVRQCLAETVRSLFLRNRMLRRVPKIAHGRVEKCIQSFGWETCMTERLEAAGGVVE